MLHDCPSVDEWHRGVPTSIRLPAIFGAVVLLAWSLGFGAWASLAPLQGAVVASGSFVPTGQNKQVQHLEGGIIREMLVKEGDLVEKDQLLLRLDDTAAKAKLRRLVLREYRLLAQTARLRAEIGGAGKLDLPGDLTKASGDPEVAAIIKGQNDELDARKASQADQEEVFRKEIAGLKESIQGYEAQATSSRSRLALFKQEIDDKSRLLDQQLIRKSEYLALQRSEASIEGELGELIGRIGDAQELIARANQKITELRSTAVEQAVSDLRSAESELDDVEEQILAAQDVVNRTEVRAPVRGVVVKLHQYTPSGVVAPGGVILELVPVDDELLIEARVKPNDITHIKEGQDALVRLTALNQRVTPMVEAKLTYVSADAVPEQQETTAGEPEPPKRYSFIVRARLDQNDLKREVANFRPSPGMPADVYIKTGERTFLTYLMRPVLDSFSRAFREQ
jgi:HlyD family type I secretion membrane fusion protein